MYKSRIVVKDRLFEIIGFVGAIITIIVGIDTYQRSVLDWLLSPTRIPTWLIISLLGGMSLFLVISGRLLFTRTKAAIIKADADSVRNYIVNTGILKNSLKMDLLTYTAETLVTPWRHILEKHDRSLQIRLLVRRPETDPNKHNVSEGCLNTVAEICIANPNINIDVRFYQHDPLLRLQFYFQEDSATCLAGIYRYDPKQVMRFIGAEENEMFVLKKNREKNIDLFNAYHSRFEYQWQRCSSLRAVIFDMDGVLINSMDYHLKSWLEAFLNANINVNEAEFRHYIYALEGQNAHLTAETLYKKYVGMPTSTNIINKLVEDKRRIYLELSSKAEPFDGVYSVLDYLKSCGVPLALVTGSTREAVYNIEKRLFPSVFKVVISGNDVDKGKPHPQPYLKALEQLKIGNREHCLVIENAPLGVRSAVKAGIPVYGILMDSPIDSTHLENAGAKKVFAGHQALLQEIVGLHFNTFICKIPNTPGGNMGTLVKK